MTAPLKPFPIVPPLADADLETWNRWTCRRYWAAMERLHLACDALRRIEQDSAGQHGITAASALRAIGDLPPRAEGV